jgi:hypothetical protein
MYTVSMIGQLMTVEQLVEWELAVATEVLQENRHQCHFVYNKSHMTYLIWD